MLLVDVTRNELPNFYLSTCPNTVLSLCALYIGLWDWQNVSLLATLCFPVELVWLKVFYLNEPNFLKIVALCEWKILQRLEGSCKCSDGQTVLGRGDHKETFAFLFGFKYKHVTLICLPGLKLTMSRKREGGLVWPVCSSFSSVYAWNLNGELAVTSHAVSLSYF